MIQTLRTHGKCILAGEHSVVRGGDAIVFPLRSRVLSLSWQAADEFFVAEGPLQAPFRDAWQLALSILGIAPPSLQISLESNIPERAGLGSSAALSVAIVRLLEKQGAKIEKPAAFAMEIENLFHGKSSGIDVACVVASKPIQYRRASGAVPLEMAWEPKLFLLDTKLRSSTKVCVEKVEMCARPDLDARMQEAALLAKAALGEAKGERALADAMQMAASCFEEWGLGAPPELEKNLRDAGALAVKPTGSGGGGFLLSLWKESPPKTLGLIPVGADF